MKKIFIMVYFVFLVMGIISAKDMQSTINNQQSTINNQQSTIKFWILIILMINIIF